MVFCTDCSVTSVDPRPQEITLTRGSGIVSFQARSDFTGMNHFLFKTVDETTEADIPRSHLQIRDLLPDGI